MSASETICRAIGKRRLLSFVYKGSVRTVEPYILGYEEGGRLTLSAVQVLGGSGKGFRSFSVEGISALVMSDRHFQRDHPDYNPRDRFFAQVICQI